MVPVGIEALNVFGGSAYLDVMQLVEHRGLEKNRFDNLLMVEKALALPFEDPVTFGVNAAKPILDKMTDEEKDRIEMVITCTESGIDFGKSLSTYMHDYLGLNRNCRLFEIKQACYAGTAGFQMAVNFVLAQTSPGAKVLVIATDIARYALEEGSDVLTEDWSYAEPSSGAGAVAMLISEQPHVFQVDVGANGYYSYEVMDTCRPVPDGEAGDSDLSLLSYLDCCENAFLEYQKRVPDVNYKETFQYLAFHTPFGGMVKGAHRTMMRKILKAKPQEIEVDFKQRVLPGLEYCQRVGNIMGGTIFMSLAGIIDMGDFETSKRLGCFSYGSGCASEFYSGIVSKEGQQLQRQYDIKHNLDERYELTMEEYHQILLKNSEIKFGTRNVKLDPMIIPGAYEKMQGKGKLVLKEIKEFHREYEWLS